ncbi:hypothetical protein, partial [Acidithiobacillus sp.]|uniref:hypothetical protein n=1 Tax=Acidithiobacillus sp. TaxID=1872118 RepID=UPI003D065ECA
MIPDTSDPLGLRVPLAVEAVECVGGGLAAPFNVPRRSLRQGLRVPGTLIDRSTGENVSSNPSPEQQGWTERPMDEIRDMGPDAWDRAWAIRMPEGKMHLRSRYHERPLSV